MTDYLPATDLLRERVLLITGAAGGIGHAVALACARHGARVILHDRTEKSLEKIYDAIEAGGGPAPAMLPLDLMQATPDACAALAQTVEREFGRLDGLLHCAAELGALAPLELYEPPTWLRVLQVNLTAAWLVTRACLPLLKQSPDASIVFTTADVGRQGRAPTGAPTASPASGSKAWCRFSPRNSRPGPNCASTASTRARCVRRCAPRPIRAKTRISIRYPGKLSHPIYTCSGRTVAGSRAAASVRSGGTNRRLSPSNPGTYDVANRINNPREISDAKTVPVQIAYVRRARAARRRGPRRRRSGRHHQVSPERHEGEWRACGGGRRHYPGQGRL